MICLNSISISPHILAFFEPLAKMCGNRAEYQYNVDKHDKERMEYGWNDETQVYTRKADTPEARRVREEADVLIDAMRDVEVLEKRSRAGKLSFYASERWFKPPLGLLRLLHPRYFMMARKLCRLLAGGHVFYLAQGPYAAMDMARMCGLMKGKLQYLFRCPKIAYQKFPGAKIDSDDCGSMYLWGYFVHPSNAEKKQVESVNSDGEASRMRVLWVGRMLDWKRLKDLVEAVKKASSQRDVVLDIYGEGPEKEDICRRAKGFPNIRINGFVKAEKVRALMRSHDVYVLPSNEYEGWGAVVSEALEENMCVYGTRQSGASMAILPDENLYDCGDVDGLSRMLCRPPVKMTIGMWSGENAARSLLRIINDISR